MFLEFVTINCVTNEPRETLVKIESIEVPEVPTEL
ncbi:hypothetical protein AJ81_10080 [Pseudothermotoga hypogea DSM 11164 = NBRC 106472]|uniref:Uncharacterized protein n=1 Tax=Pseudothermotoga hypogea DSM 11164 = NBRC 106472 TaxID=1123384 RepID=A0A0X1KUH4_9THEM|nr:hypothetical protein AJ81_10080 [Pseudothermotoga hypogea DSM 11164 = NBRC 106472]